MLRSMTYSINGKTKWANYLCKGTLEFKRLSLVFFCYKSQHKFDKFFYNFLFNKLCENGNSSDVFWLISCKCWKYTLFL